MHGAVDRSATFQATRRALTPLPVLTYDRRGSEGSVAVPAAEAPTVHVADLFELVDAQPLVLIGHSFGGLVALAAAAEAPEMVRAVGVYEPPLPWFDWWPSVITFDSPETATESFSATLSGIASGKASPNSSRQTVDARARR